MIFPDQEDYPRYSCLGSCLSVVFYFNLSRCWYFCFSILEVWWLYLICFLLGIQVHEVLQELRFFHLLVLTFSLITIRSCGNDIRFCLYFMTVLCLSCQLPTSYAEVATHYNQEHEFAKNTMDITVGLYIASLSKYVSCSNFSCSALVMMPFY